MLDNIKQFSVQLRNQIVFNQQKAVQNAAIMALANSVVSSPQVPKIVKTTTKQTIVQNAGGLQHKKEEKVEDLTPGGTGAVTVVSSLNKV